MTPEKWKILMDDAHLVEKPFLYFYRLYLKYPWWIFAFWIAFCVGAFIDVRPTLEGSDEFLPVLIFIVGIGPAFFFFGAKAITWILLRIRGFRSEDLRIE